MGHEVLDHVLVAEPVAARDRVVEVFRQAVVGTHARRGAALRRHRVAAHRHDLGDERHAQAGIAFRGGNRGAQAGAAAADDHHVRLDHLHRQAARQTVIVIN